MGIFCYVDEDEKLFFSDLFCFCLLFFWGLFIVIVIYVNVWRLGGTWDWNDELGEDEFVCEEWDSQWDECECRL